MKPKIFALKLPLDEASRSLFFKHSKRSDEILRIKNEKSRDLKLVSEFLAKAAIKKVFGVDIKNQSFEKDEYGKPYLSGFSDIHFNLSHSHSMVFCAVCDTPVGIDAELIFEHKERLVKRVCNEDELLQIENADDRWEEFTKIWTKKEAYLKFLGTGIQSFNLKNVLDDFDKNVSTEIIDGYAVTVIW